ncbi:MAG: OsmC family protein [Gammaproteobacteria bacterium]
MKRTASAVWSGDLKSGKGAISTQSKTLKSVPYSFSMRFEDGQGTNPEELIGAAHAGCFTMALSAFLSKAGFTATQLETSAEVSLEEVEGNWTVTKIDLHLKAQIAKITKKQFSEIANDAKTKCPISRLFKAEISLTAELIGE